MKHFILRTAVAVMVMFRAAAVDMTLYNPSEKVEAGFSTFVKELYAETEDPSSTTTFTDFFTPEGSLVVLKYAAVGAEKIAGLKQALMPTNGLKIWNHLPNSTTVSAETETTKTYTVLGVIQTTYADGNCSQAYYSTRFTVTKNSDLEPNLSTHSGSLILYDDYIVDPAVSPTDIACQALGADTYQKPERDEL